MSQSSTPTSTSQQTTQTTPSTTATFVLGSEQQQQQQQQQQQPSQQAQQGVGSAGYQHKKLGDLMDEVDDLLSDKRAQLTQKATEQVQGLMKEVQHLYHEMKSMAQQQNVDPQQLASKQEKLNQLENQAVQGVYGAQAQICPLDQPDQPHHVRVDAIPPGQASIRWLIEKSHQLVTRVMDRVENTISSSSLSSAPTGSSIASSTASVAVGGPETGKIETKPAIDVTTTSGTKKQKEETKEQETIPHIAKGARTAEGTSAPITAQGPGAGISGH